MVDESEQILYRSGNTIKADISWGDSVRKESVIGRVLYDVRNNQKRISFNVLGSRFNHTHTSEIKKVKLLKSNRTTK